MKTYSDFIHASRYARYLPDESRRETWDETVTRWIEFMAAEIEFIPSKTERQKLLESVYTSIRNKEVLPSMRSIMTAGPALDSNHIAAYNCAYIEIDCLEAFAETLLILMHGTGVGFSVENEVIDKLPTIPEEAVHLEFKLVIEDSRQGWSEGYLRLLKSLFHGERILWDMSAIRDKGARLRTFGGRASGPETLEELFNTTVRVFDGAKGRKLTSLECHDLICNIAQTVVVGGVRRSALISLSDLDDESMQGAKMGNWWDDNPVRSYANNSAAYTFDATREQFLEEWGRLVESKSGERGIFNRASIKTRDTTPPGDLWRDRGHRFGTNPCGEIILRPMQFCNLTEAVIRQDDSKERVLAKIIAATIIGTWQSSLTEFKGLRDTWKDNCEDERLLGVSLTGIYDNKFFSTPSIKLEQFLTYARQRAIQTNESEAKVIGVNPSLAITTVKPSGTVSQLVDSSSGIHPRYAKYYYRRVRGDVKDPLMIWMQRQGIHSEPDVTNKDAIVFRFPVESPEGAVTRHDVTAIKQLELWILYKLWWTHHNPSATIYVAEDEWDEVREWVWSHWKFIGGLSFLPKEDGNHSYVQAPYEEITKEEYEKAKAETPDLNFSTFIEHDDMTDVNSEFACTSDQECVF